MRTPRIMIGVVLSCATACTTPDEDRLLFDRAAQGESIDESNDPRLFRLPMTPRLADLPAKGESRRKPFPSSWWPMRNDGIAYAWIAPQPSPAAKYDALAWPERIRDVELRLAQIDARGAPVNLEEPSQIFHVGPTAEWELRHHGRYGLIDPDSWWGHCNGWASYTLNEDEPLRPVVVRYDRDQNQVTECALAEEPGCVRFELGDINALGAEVYWSDAALVLGRRCMTHLDDLAFDPSGRFERVECRDGNAGTFHVVIANMLGNHERPVVLDLNPKEEVWNYPAYKYEITRNAPISVAEALLEIGAPEDREHRWIFNPDAATLVRVEAELSLVEDAVPPTTWPTGFELERFTSVITYDYILELDASGAIIGGEWVGRSKTSHPDFLWYSLAADQARSTDDLGDADNPSIRYSVFKQILMLAQTTRTPTVAVEARALEL